MATQTNVPSEISLPQDAFYANQAGESVADRIRRTSAGISNASIASIIATLGDDRLRDAALGGAPSPATAPTDASLSWKAYDSTVRPMVDVFVKDARRTLLTWTRDPVILCCLIKNIAAIGEIDRRLQQGTGAVSKGLDKTFGLLRRIVSILDLVIGYLQKDVSATLDENMDFLRFMMMSVIGYLISVMDKFRQGILTRIMNMIGLSPMAKRCLPFDELIAVLLQAIQHPVNGLLSRISRLLTDWTNHIRAIYRLNSCRQLHEDEGEEASLKRILAQIDEDLAVYAATPTGREQQELLLQRRKAIDQQMKTIQQKISINNGMPLIGKKGCYLQKIEFIDKLRFYRNIIEMVIRGLESGILCASMTDDELASMRDPLSDLNIGGTTAYANPLRTPYPTEEEIAQVLKEEYGIDDEVANAIHAKLIGDTDPNLGQGNLEDPGALTGEDLLDLRTRLDALEALASCTQIMDDQLIEEIIATMRRLGQPGG